MPFLMIFQREDDPLVTGTRVVATAVASETDFFAHYTNTISTIAMHWRPNFTQRDDIT